MAIANSVEDRVAARRRIMIERAIAHAVDIMTESGVAALTTTEVARRLGIKQPSFYKYFPSLNALYDELFALGYQQFSASAAAVAATAAPGVPTITACGRDFVRWTMENQALAQLMFTRPVPGFEPSAKAFAPSIDSMNHIYRHIAEAIRLGQLRADTDVDEFAGLFTSFTGGIASQQLANEPDVAFTEGRFTTLIDKALDVLVTAYRSNP